MAQNSLAPGFIYLFYETTNGQHRMTIPIQNPLSDTPNWTVRQNSNAQVSWVTGLTTYVTVLKAFYGAANTFQYAELWEKATATSDPIFRETTDLNIVGTSGSASVAYGQYVLTMRSQLGGIAKIYLMESTVAANTILTPPFSGVTLALVNHLKGNTGIHVARDEGNLISAVRVVTKINDALRKKYLLDA